MIGVVAAVLVLTTAAVFIGFHRGRAMAIGVAILVALGSVIVYFAARSAGEDAAIVTVLYIAFVLLSIYRVHEGIPQISRPSRRRRRSGRDS